MKSAPLKAGFFLAAVFNLSRPAMWLLRTAQHTSVKTHFTASLPVPAAIPDYTSGPAPACRMPSTFTSQLLSLDWEEVQDRSFWTDGRPVHIWRDKLKMIFLRLSVVQHPHEQRCPTSPGFLTLENLEIKVSGRRQWEVCQTFVGQLKWKKNLLSVFLLILIC